MNNKQKFSTLLVLSALANQASAQDVYNFYFNKNNQNQKAQIMTGSDNSPSTGIPTENENVINTASPKAESKTEVNTTPKPENKFDNWEFMVGTANSYGWGGYVEWDSYSDIDINNDYDAKGIEIGVSKNFNRYLGADFRMSSMSLQNIDGTEDFYNARAGFSFTPIRLNIIGHDFLELGAIFGIGTFQKFQVENDFGAGGGGWDRGTVVDQVTVARPYFGGRLAFNITDKVGLMLESAAIKEDDTTISNSSFSLRYRL